MGGAVFPPWSWFGMRGPSPGAYRLYGGLLLASERASTPHRCCQCPCPWQGAPATPRLCRRPANTGRQALWSRVLSSGSCYAQDFTCPPWGSLCFPPSCVSSVIKSSRPSQSDSLRIPSPVAKPPRMWTLLWGWEPSFQWENISGVIVLQFAHHPPGSFRIWFLSSLCPAYHLIVASPLSLDVRYLFLVGSSVFLLMVVHQLVVISVLSQEEGCPSTLPPWTSLLTCFKVFPAVSWPLSCQFMPLPFPPPDNDIVLDNSFFFLSEDFSGRIKAVKRTWLCYCSVAKSCPNLCNPTDCSLLGFSVHGIILAGMMERVAIFFSIWHN